MVTVFNVGQGDSILIEPDFTCNLIIDVPLLIDCGPKSAKVYREINAKKIDILLTHSHNDHIGGFVDLIPKVRNLYIPFYLPEIWQIYTYLAKYLSSNVVKIDLINNSFEKIIIVGEDDRLCEHFVVLNPPRYPSINLDFTSSELNQIKDALRILKSFGVELPEKQIINYRTELLNVKKLIFQSGIENYNIDGYVSQAKKFVENFFISLATTFLKYEGKDIKKIIRKEFQKLIHQHCIVFDYNYERKGHILFTGDADEYVFERLINKGTDISSKYLKVPHHGSKENLSLNIVKKINPEYAIFSHKNRRFGLSTDRHPHIEVLDYFEKLNVNMCFTNPVVKGGLTLYSATVGAVDGVFEFQ